MSAEMKFRVTYFRDYSASEKWERDVTLADLAAKIAEVTRPTKEQLPWLKLACFGDKRTDRGSLRHDANVRWVSGAEWDYDGGKMAFGEAVEVTEKLGLMALLYTSPSHTEDLPRWRILCPFSLGLLPDRRRQQLGRLNGAFRGIFARESWTLSQAFYFGSVNANPSHRVETIYGHTIDQLDELDECWIGPPGRSRCVYYADITQTRTPARRPAKTRNWSVPVSQANTSTSSYALWRPATSVAVSARTPWQTCSVASCSPPRRPRATPDGPIGTTASVSWSVAPWRNSAVNRSRLAEQSPERPGSSPSEADRQTKSEPP
jgi:hypothetical protein